MNLSLLLFLIKIFEFGLNRKNIIIIIIASSTAMLLTTVFTMVFYRLRDSIAIEFIIIIISLLLLISSGFFGRKLGVNGSQFIILSLIITESLNILLYLYFDSLTVSMLIPSLFISPLVHGYFKGILIEKYSPEYNILKTPGSPSREPGFKHSEATIESMRNAAAKRSKSPKFRENLSVANPDSIGVKVTDLETNTITTYRAIRVAARALGLDKRYIENYIYLNVL
jgi:NUMOD1 domain